MAFEPNKITREHVEAAVKKIEGEGIQLKSSTKYLVKIGVKSYPSKEIMRYAHEQMNGEKLWKFSGGDPTNKFLSKMNFEISESGADPIKVLLEKYKDHLRTNQLKDEKYKWQLISDFGGRPDLEAEDFLAEIKAVNYSNLIYPMAKAVLQHLILEKPEEIRNEFKILFDESIALADRVGSFNANTLAIYRDLGEKKQHHQDERSIATYLTYKYPEKYTFYKNQFYKEYCKLLGIKSAKTGKKYVHYLSLIDDLVSDYIAPDKELLGMAQDYLGDLFDVSSLRLLAQDFLYQMLGKETEPNYWVFQGNPDHYDFKTAFEKETLDDWTVSSHIEEVKKGDKVILWITGKESGCYALGEITYDPILFEDDSDPLWKIESTNDIKAGIKITHNLFDRPITKDDIQTIPAFSKLNVGVQGTNFSATKEEYDKFIEMIDSKSARRYWLYSPGKLAEMWDEFYQSGIMALNWNLNDLREYTKEQLVEELKASDPSDSSKKNDATANFEFANVMSVGDVVIVKKGRGQLVGYGTVSSDYFYDDERATFKHVRKVDWNRKGVWDYPGQLASKTLTDITIYESEKSRGKKFYEFLLDIINGTNEVKEETEMKPRNLILYGPPGTGKTHALKTQYFPQYTSSETSITKEKHFENVVKNCSWWQVIAVALLDLKKSKVSEIQEHAWVQEKARLSKSNTIRPTIWGQLQSHTIEECEFVNVSDKRPPFLFNKTKDSYWEILEENVQEQAPDILELIDSVKNFKPNPDKEVRRYVFTTFHQSYSYEDFIEGLKPLVQTEEVEETELRYVIEPGIFKKLCAEAELDPHNKYAFFIDEINRGNVAQIFGELITLIETDKRAGAENEISADLPYSKKPFSVPSNVDIIGTMNTADRSVEALDAALRRRFSFEYKGPDYELEELDYLIGETGKTGKVLLKLINSRISYLKDEDHQIGHSYLMNKDTPALLRNTFAMNIIPLLKEYFYNDYAKMRLVLGDGFMVKEGAPKFAVKDADIIEQERYSVVTIDESFDIISALKETLEEH